MTATTQTPHRGPANEVPQRFLNVSEAAKAMRLDPSTLYRHLREGRFPSIRVGGRYLIPAAVLDHLAQDAMATGGRVDVEQWSTQWREDRAVAILTAGQRPAHPDGGAAR